ncbi:MAG: anhydro-N-acetylmuramic acid kinase [Prolixibacteraceae bacterium]
MGREWMENHFLPLVHSFNCSTEDKLRTIYEHIAIQISHSLHGKGKMLVTGGGAFNSFLMERIRHHSNVEIVLPPPEIISFKEAIIFAFLGLLRHLGEINCYASVTGARKDSSAGIIFHP